MRIGTMFVGLLLLSTWLPAVGAADDKKSSDAEPYEVVKDFDVGPRIVKQTKPSYPARAYQQGLHGVVTVEFVVDTNGRVRDPKVVSSKEAPGAEHAFATRELLEEAVRTVREWRFEPARKNGRPVAVVARAPIGFTIGGDKKRTPTPQH
jgi:protein TonB